jgi:ADP-ribosyl-[dinitrogen reductase] hydrolase
MSKDRAAGALLGLAVGDALGTTYEFRTLTQPDYPTLATGPATDIIGGGPFDLTPGQVTDDTQLAVCIARSLVERRGFDPADIATRYVGWVECAFDVGGQTNAAIDKLRAGVPYSSAGLEVWRDRGRRPAGNGSLMRTAPIAVAFAGSQKLVENAIVESMITHADPRCALACGAFDAAIAALIRGDDMMAAARAALAEGAALLRAAWNDPTDREHLERACDDLASDLDAALAPQPGVYRPGLHLHETQGFVRVAFRLAFWHAVHTRTYREAVVDVASRGGDADTNGAIVGALVGARDGLEAIPEAWRLCVLAARQRGSEAWSDAHRPRHLLALVEN